MKEIHDKIIGGLREFLRRGGFTKACLGMSGGGDSAVVLALVAEIMPAENIKVLMLPSRFSSDHSVRDAEKMIATLGVRSELISIQSPFEAVLKSLEPIIGGTRADTTEENIQSRLRCVMLMALSNKEGHILLNTSNKSEAAVGYGTLYGDMAGAVGVIADIYKTEVYALARYINREREIIPENIILKPPSAELRFDQKDSDSLPPYDVLDAILHQLVEEGRGVEQVTGFDMATVRRVEKMLKGAAFKRQQAPPAIQVSEKPLGATI